MYLGTITNYIVEDAYHNVCFAAIILIMYTLTSECKQKYDLRVSLLEVS